MYNPAGRLNGLHSERGKLLEDRLCYIDMDGVLTDLIKAICARHNVPNPYLYSTDYIGIWDTACVLGMSNTQFWSVTESHEFWANLPKTPWADEIISRAVKSYGWDRMRICSSPALSHWSWSGKAAWIRKWYPKLSRKMRLMTDSKFELAKPGRMLLDDKPSAVYDWVGAGGCGIVIPADWNGASSGNISLI
jgi:5'(3')-deoxyribonucleotidase